MECFSLNISPSCLSKKKEEEEEEITALEQWGKWISKKLLEACCKLVFFFFFINSIVKAMVFPVVMYGYESWSIKKAEH